MVGRERLRFENTNSNRNTKLQNCILLLLLKNNKKRNLFQTREIWWYKIDIIIHYNTICGLEIVRYLFACFKLCHCWESTVCSFLHTRAHTEGERERERHSSHLEVMASSAPIGHGWLWNCWVFNLLGFDLMMIGPYNVEGLEEEDFDWRYRTMIVGDWFLIVIYSIYNNNNNNACYGYHNYSVVHV